MAGKEGTAKFFEAANETSDALIDATRAANDRAHRFTAAVLQEVQEGQRETVELTKRWAEAPLDIFGFYSGLIETTTKAQGRALDVTRQWFGELSEMQKETRETVQKLISANRAANEASIEIARGVFSRATEFASSNGDGRRARETAKSAD